MNTGDYELTGLEIAVIGMAGRFPQAKNIEEFWENLKNGIECISFFTKQELEKAGIAPEALNNPGYVKAKAVLEDIEYFDSSFFGYTPIESAVMDPQTRIFHECAWEALEDAGYAPGTYKGRIGVYAGAASHSNWEMLALISGKAGVLGEFISWQLYDKDFMSTRLSYNLDLLGPSVNVYTACSTSLAAVHLACQALLGGECHLALAGGIRLSVVGKTGYISREGMVSSSDGHCRPFDAKANGTVSGEGVGLVVLKPLENAIADRDFIYALIKSSALNNDGRGKVGYMAPGIKGQAAAIRRAHRVGTVKPESITYVETHGTGTNLGDPSEIEALVQAFNTGKKGFCRIGSIKSNMGHLDTAAGIAGFIKTVLALKHKHIPPSLHFETPNPKIDFDSTPFIVNRELYQWKSNGYPLRAGVSSFGVGGTNAHVILEEWSPGQSTEHKGHDAQGREYQIILLSAKTPSALERMTGNFIDYLKKNPHIELADAAYSLAVGRKALLHRKMVVATSIRETIAYLSHPGRGKVYEFTAKEDQPPVVFMFSGQGSQYTNMAWDLYQKENRFRQEMDQCFGLLNTLVDYDIKEILYPSQKTNSEAENLIQRQDVIQPLMFILEYALARLLISWGIEPYAMIGYSIGEYVAACLSGVFSLEDALRIVALRGKMMHELPGGTMISIPLPEDEVLPLLKDHENISVAVVNGPSCIVSGPGADIRVFETYLKEKRLLSMRLGISHAGHSCMMDPMLDKFHKELEGISYKKPSIPFISTLTGQWITVDQATAPLYWTRHLRETVRFAEGITIILKEEHALLMELGPGNVLGTVVMQHPARKAGHRVLNLLKHPGQKVPGLSYFFTRIALLWLYGGNIHWKKFYEPEKRYRMPLPAYPFDKYAYPADITLLRRLKQGEGLALFQKSHSKDKPAPRKRADIADWFYLPHWKPSPLPLFSPGAIGGRAKDCWLVFMGNGSLSNRLVRQLKETKPGPELVIVRQGKRYSQSKAGEYRVSPGENSHYSRLLESLPGKGEKITTIVHLWNITPGKRKEAGARWVETCQEKGYYSLINLARALGNSGLRHKVNVIVFSDSMQGVPGSRLLYPEKATLLGPVRVIPGEYPNIRCRSVDIDLPTPGTKEENQLVTRLLEELTTGTNDIVTAYRGNQRLVQRFEPFRWERAETIPRLKEKGVYLVIGGLGGVGFVFAENLAVNFRARVILTSRSSFPCREEWEQWLSRHGETHPVSRKIQKIRAMEKKGAEVVIYQADVSDFSQMEKVFYRVKERFGNPDGVIHCALVLEGALIHRVSRDLTSRVFAARVNGALVLKRLMERHPPGFLVLCSSLSSIFSSPGEVVYCATNNFLDAFAYHMDTCTDNDIYTLSINWDAWQEVGGAVAMAKRRLESLRSPTSPSVNINHPLLQKRTSPKPGQTVYISRLNPARHWPLDEHRVMGKATLPGTAYLEMARAAYENLEENPIENNRHHIEIQDLFLTAPLVVQDHEEKEVRILLEKKENAYEFRVISRVGPGSQSQWQEHARGKITGLENEPPRKHDLKKLEALCPREESIVSREQSPQEKPGRGLTRFGPRWMNNTRRWKSGENRYFKVLELDEAFSADLEVYQLHPALLDAAFGIPENQGRHAPFSYQKVKISGKLPGKFYLSLILSNGNANHTPASKTLSCSITLMDEQGVERLRVEEYTLLAVSENRVEESVLDLWVKPVGGQEAPGDEWLKDYLREGIHPAEGVEVFTRVLAGTGSRVLVSTRSLEERMAGRKARPARETPGILKRLKEQRPTHPRPDLSTRYVAPQSETQQQLAEIWQNFLGIDRVGIHDNFFDLGATSLTIMNINRLVKERLGKDLAVVNMYIYPTVSELARFLDQEETGGILSLDTPGTARKKSNKKQKLTQRKKKFKGEQHA